MDRLISSLIFSFFIIGSWAAINLPGSWPRTDVAPPPVPSWTALVNQTTILNIPISGEICPSTDTYCSWRCAPKCSRSTDIESCSQIKDWGFSFDDGPSNNTLPVLDFLKSQGIKATFFVIGSRVIEYPDILNKTYAAGHDIAIHTWSHTKLTTQTNEQIIAELKWTEKAIKQVIGITPKFMRPPYGDLDDRVREIIKQLNYTAILWDSDSKDWTSIGAPSFNISWITGNFTIWSKNTTWNSGHISLQHDLYKQTAAEIPPSIKIVQNAGFTIKSVSNCIGRDPYQEIGAVHSESINTNTMSTNSTVNPQQSKGATDRALNYSYIIRTILFVFFMFF
ncbi:10131_t:CDS:2 [Ambispora gerdemannii]|uniref:chitin deacetylase n=1 Tax=Ambispora gerdemannii TaxID=144530 RepID=A0A9N8YPA8_9GLOM|nr:10131_t:CDS:2 [Ambispora gerdemannii]